MAVRRARPARLLASAVLLGIAGLFLALALVFHARGAQWANEFSGVAGFLVALAAALSPLAGRMLKWLREGPAEQAQISPEQAAEDLREALTSEWKQEEGFRKVNDPWPLPIRWQVGERARAAMLGIDWRETGKPGRPVTPSKLRGSFEDIAETFTEGLPWRRLVVLGGAGSGKTMLVIRLALELLSDHAAGGQVPVLLSAASWQPGRQAVLDFAESQLIRDRSGLGSLVTEVGGKQVTLARHLLNSDRILLILDGLDEIPQPLRTLALRRLSAYPADKPLVVTSRPVEYEQAVECVGRGLPRAVVIELHALSVPDVSRYLPRATSPPERRWQPVLDYLASHRSGDLAEVLQTPLMIWLTRAVYAKPETAPGDLVALVNADDKAVIENHLMSELIPALYAQGGDYEPRSSVNWAPHAAERWLSYLAWHLQQEGSYDLAWWDLNRRVPRLVHGILGGIPIGAPIGLAVAVILGIAKGPVAGLGYGLAAGVGIALLAGLPGGLSSWRQMIPSRVEVRIRGNLTNLASRLVLGLLFGFGFGALIGLPITFFYGLGYGVLVALTLGPAIGLALSAP